MANRHRGETSLAIGDQRFRLCLTLQALAEIEAHFCASDLSALGERLSGGRLSARDLAALLGAAIRGGGHGLRDDEVATMIGPGDLPSAVMALGDAFSMAFGAERLTPGSALPARPGKPQDA